MSVRIISISSKNMEFMPMEDDEDGIFLTQTPSGSNGDMFNEGINEDYLDFTSETEDKSYVNGVGSTQYSDISDAEENMNIDTEITSQPNFEYVLLLIRHSLTGV